MEHFSRSCLTPGTRIPGRGSGSWVLGTPWSCAHKSLSAALLLCKQAKQGTEICPAQAIKLLIAEDRQKSGMQLPELLLSCLFSNTAPALPPAPQRSRTPIPAALPAAAPTHNQPLLSTPSRLCNQSLNLQFPR